MVILDEMPKTGQFVMIWQHNGVIWSETRKWEDGKLWYFLEGVDEWNIYVDGKNSMNNIKYVVTA